MNRKAVMGLMLFGAFLSVLMVSCGSGIEQQESSRKYRLEKLSQIQSKLTGDAQADLSKRKSELEARYANLPVEPQARGDELGKINQALNGAIEEFEAKAKSQALVKEQDAQSAQAQKKREWIERCAGTWTGGGIDLTIENGGRVTYKRVDGAVVKSAEGGISRFDETGFDIDVLGFKTTFKIDGAPRQEGGVWKMAVDGVEVQRKTP